MKWNSLARLSRDELIDWAQKQSWAVAMRNCRQDAKWHAEGDVWTHTIRVCRELDSVDGWAELTTDEQSVLRLAALFHDAAKPQTTMVEDVTGRVRSPKHTVKGESLARSILRELECPFLLREMICGLVRNHGKPVFLAEQQFPEIELARLSFVVRHDLLFILAVADLRGRDAIEGQRSQDDLICYRELAKEQKCFGQPYPIANDHARFLLGRRQLTNLHYTPHQEFSCRVTMMSGLPGSGKDSWLREHRPELPVVSLDAFRKRLGVSPTENQGAAVQAARERCRELLRQRVSFALNATNITRPMPALWIDLFASYNARNEIVNVEQTVARTKQQNQNRENPVPDSVIERLAEKSEPATVLEAHEVIHVLGEPLQMNNSA